MGSIFIAPWLHRLYNNPSKWWHDMFAGDSGGSDATALWRMASAHGAVEAAGLVAMHAYILYGSLLPSVSLSIFTVTAIIKVYK